MQNLRISLTVILLTFSMPALFSQGLKGRGGAMLSKGKETFEKTRIIVTEGKETVEKAKIAVEEGKKKIDSPSTSPQKAPQQQSAPTNSRKPAAAYQVGGTSVSSFHPKYKVMLDSCIGDRNTQVVTLFFRVQQNDAHQLMTIQVSDNRTQAYDSQGSSRKAQLGTIAGSSARYTVQQRIPTDMDVPCSIEFTNIVDTKNTMLKQVFIYCQSVDANGGTNGVWGEIEIKNLPIVWQ